MSPFLNPAWLPFSVSEAVTAGDATAADLETGRAWEHFAAALSRAGKRVLSDEVPHGSVDMASGFRHLLVLLGVGIDELLRRGLDTVPAVKPSSTDAALKWGMECPDALYLNAELQAGMSYRLWGNRGSARYVGLQAMSGMASTANALLDEFELGPDGEFDITLSAELHEGNWLPLDESATMLVVRHFFYDWENEVPATMHIEPLGGARIADTPVPTDVQAAMARQLIALGDYLEDNLGFFLNFAKPEEPNSFLPPFDGSAMGAAAENRPVIGAWSLAADQALVIEVEPPEGVYWSYSLGNAWWETIDYANHQSSLNGFQAVPDSDGVVRVVVAHDDPGVANWLDTAGHTEGPIILRCVRTDVAPFPRTSVMPFDQVSAALPATTARVTPDERGDILTRRRVAVSGRFCR